MMFHAQIAQRAFNMPLLVEPSKAMAFLSGLVPRITGRRLSMIGLEIAPEDMARATLPARVGILNNGLTERYQRDGQTPFRLQDGVAVIEVSGVLVHRGAWIGQSSGQTSYEGIAAQLAAAASDPIVRGIALEIDSFGGEVAGVFDLADAIRAARAAKPVWALVAEHAFSAGYALASQADRIFADANMAVDALWFAVGVGLGVAVRVIRKSPDEITSFGAARILSETTLLDARVADMPTPAAGDLIRIGAEDFLVQGEPKLARERLMWTLNMRAV